MAATRTGSQPTTPGSLRRIAITVSTGSALGKHLTGEVRLYFEGPDGGEGCEVLPVGQGGTPITARAQGLLALARPTSPSQLLFATLVLAAARPSTDDLFRRHHVFDWAVHALGRRPRAKTLDGARRSVINQLRDEFAPQGEAGDSRLFRAEASGEWVVNPAVTLTLEAPAAVREAAEAVLRVRAPSQQLAAKPGDSQFLARYFETALQAELHLKRYAVACGMPGAGLRTLAVRLARAQLVEVDVTAETASASFVVSAASKAHGSPLLIHCRVTRAAKAEELEALGAWLAGAPDVQVFVSTRSKALASSWAGLAAPPTFVTGFSDEEVRLLCRSRGVIRELVFAGELGWRMADAVRHPAIANALAEALRADPTLDLSVVPYGPLPMNPELATRLRPIRDAIWDALPAQAGQVLDAWAICERASTAAHLAEVVGCPVDPVEAVLAGLIDACMVERRGDRFLLDHGVRWLSRSADAWRAYVGRQSAYLVARLQPADRLRVDHVGEHLKDVQALLDALLAESGHDRTILHLASAVDFVLGLRRSVTTGKRLIAAAVDAAVREGDLDTERWMHYALSLHLKNSGDYEGAWRGLERLVAMCAGSGDPEVTYQRVIAHEEMGAIRMQLGDLAEARRLLLGALDDSEPLFLRGAATPRGMAITLTTCGNLEIECGAPAAAFPYFERAHRMVSGPAPVGQEIGYAIEVARAMHGKGTARFCVGDYAEAHAYYNEAYSIRRLHDMRHQFPRSLLRLAVTLDARGRSSEAEEVFAQANRWATELNEARQVAQYHHWFGIFLARRGRRTEAEASFVQAAKEFSRLGRRLTLAKVEGLLRDLRAGRLEATVARHRY